MLLVLYLRMHCLIQCYGFTPLFSPQRFMRFIVLADPLVVNVYIGCEVVGQLHSLHVHIQLSQHNLLKKLFLYNHIFLNVYTGTTPSQ